MRSLTWWMIIPAMAAGCASDMVDIDASMRPNDAAVPIVDASLIPDASDDPDAGTDAGSEDAGAMGVEPTGGIAMLSFEQRQKGEPAVFALRGSVHPELEAPQAFEKGVPRTCEPSATAGDCGFYACEAAARASAGILIVEVEGGEVLRATPRADLLYRASREGVVAAPNDVIAFAASGDEVPAFALKVTAPSAPQAELPDKAERGKVLELKWVLTAPADGVQVVIESAGDAIVCRAQWNQATLSVPSELLGMLSDGAASVALSSFNMEVATRHAYRVLVTAAETIDGALVVE